jgi:hypothetical protein
MSLNVIVEECFSIRPFFFENSISKFNFSTTKKVVKHIFFRNQAYYIKKGLNQQKITRDIDFRASADKKVEFSHDHWELKKFLFEGI